MTVKFSKPSLVFILVSELIIPYMLLKQLQGIAYHTDRKLSSYVDLAVSYAHIKRVFVFSSFRNLLPNTESTAYQNQIEESYALIKFTHILRGKQYRNITKRAPIYLIVSLIMLYEY